MKKKQAEENDRIYEPKNDLILQKVSCVLVIVGGIVRISELWQVDHGPQQHAD